MYSQELTKEVSLVSKADDRGNVHYGVRMFMASPDILHNTPDDDDRTAVTFWLPNCGSFSASDLADVFGTASRLAMRAGEQRTASEQPQTVRCEYCGQVVAATDAEDRDHGIYKCKQCGGNPAAERREG